MNRVLRFYDYEQSFAHYTERIKGTAGTGQRQAASAEP